MKKKIVFKMFTLILIFSLIVSCSKTPKFDHYGVFINQKGGFKEVKGYEWTGFNDVYKNSRDYDKSPVLFNDVLEIYVYNSKAKTSEYKLIKPNRSNKYGDFVCANFGFGKNCPEEEFTIQPIEDKDDMVVIKSNPISGILILHIKDENKGYVFQTEKQNKLGNQKTNSKIEKKIIGKWEIAGDEVYIFKANGEIEGKNQQWVISDKKPYQISIIHTKSDFMEKFKFKFINDNTMEWIEVKNGEDGTKFTVKKIN